MRRGKFSNQFSKFSIFCHPPDGPPHRVLVSALIRRARPLQGGTTPGRFVSPPRPGADGTGGRPVRPETRGPGRRTAEGGPRGVLRLAGHERARPCRLCPPPKRHGAARAEEDVVGRDGTAGPDPKAHQEDEAARTEDGGREEDRAQNGQQDEEEVGVVRAIMREHFETFLVYDIIQLLRTNKI